MSDTDPALFESDEDTALNIARHPRGGVWARALLTSGVVCLPLGVALPAVETTQFWVFRDQYSLIDTARALLDERSYALAALVGLFSLLTPTLKTLSVISLHLGWGGPALAQWVEQLGKWSFADVLVVALIIVLTSTSGVLSAAALPGLWFFAASAGLLMLASGLIVRDFGAERRGRNGRNGEI